MSALRDYQLDVLEKARHAIEGGAKSVLIQLQTGLGKTRTAAFAAQNHLRLGGKGVLFVAPRKELVDQARKTLGDDLRIHVRTIQGLTDTPEASLVILDEARHYLSDEWSKVRERYPHAIFLGLDATPERADGRGLGTMFDAIVTGISVKRAIAEGYLVEPHILRPDRNLQPGELAQDPVAAYLEHAKDTRAIGFFPSVKEAQRVAEEARAANVSSEAVWGEMPTKQRAAALEAFSLGYTDLLTCSSLLLEGYDCPAVETVILARGFGTAGGFLQAVGRALRPFEGKTRALVLDLRGVSHVHGDPTEERTYHLEGKAVRRANEGPDVRFCPVCGGTVAQLPCEQCGHSGELRHRKPRILGLALTRFAKLREDDEDTKAARLSRWMSHARSKGWREGQAFYRFKGAYGQAPSRALIQRARAMAD
jgi:DNA repair protein RadD